MAQNVCTQRTVTRHADIDNGMPKPRKQEVMEMNRQTFIDDMKARGYELESVGNGNVVARKGDCTLRWVALADYGVHIATPTVTALTREDATDAETLRIIDALTA